MYFFQVRKYQMLIIDYLKMEKKSKQKNSLVTQSFKQNHCQHFYIQSFSLFFYASVCVCVCVFVTYFFNGTILYTRFWILAFISVINDEQFSYFTKYLCTKYDVGNVYKVVKLSSFIFFFKKSLLTTMSVSMIIEK